MPTTASREEWLAARLELLEAEKELQRKRDQVAAQRRALPRVRVEADYRFDTQDGSKSLSELFGAASQLVVQHFMMGPDWEAGCPSCSFMADGLNGNLAHLAARDCAFVAVSNTSLERIAAYKARMGWDFEWVSSLGSPFNRDFQASYSPEDVAAGEIYYNFRKTRFPSTETPGISVFARDGETVFHTYSTYSRGLDPFITTYQFLDILPKGRDEAALDYPMAWVRRHDEYEVG